MKEPQILVRHSTPGLTMNKYARARMDRLHKLAETSAAMFAPEAFMSTVTMKLSASRSGRGHFLGHPVSGRSESAMEWLHWSGWSLKR